MKSSLSAEEIVLAGIVSAGKDGQKYEEEAAFSLDNGIKDPACRCRDGMLLIQNASSLSSDGRLLSKQRRRCASAMVAMLNTD